MKRPSIKRPGVIGAPGPQSRDERAKPDLNQHGDDEYDGRHA